MFIKCMAVGVGGFIGSVARYLVSRVELQHSGNYPINTLLVNLIGAVLIGYIIATAKNNGMSEEKMLFLKMGVCGGLTTFSTFSVETWGYVQSGNILMAVAYAGISVLLCVLGVMLGLRMA